jgi:hypothetical protein
MFQIYTPNTGIKIMLALDSDRHSGTVKIASTKHFSAEVNAASERILGTPKLLDDTPNACHSANTTQDKELFLKYTVKISSSM